jgi:type II secretory pathway component PulF
MDETLGRISVYFEALASEKVKRLTASLEPLILVVLGIGVGFLVFSIVMPMYELTQAF